MPTEPAAQTGVAEPLYSSFPSLHALTSHCQLGIGQGGVFNLHHGNRQIVTDEESFPRGEQVVKHFPVNPWSQVFSGQFLSRGLSLGIIFYLIRFFEFYFYLFN